MTVTQREELPRYNTGLGAAEATLVVAPPFTFPGVTARVFPLRANMNILTSFCTHYLNVAPDICELRPYFPYVLLVVLDYGRMAIEEFNLGWVSQHEVFFAVPLGMSRRNRRGRWTFDKWVLNTPFIVVDNAASLTTGRETYGWPKVFATLRDSPERWLIDPRNATRFLTLDVKGPDSDLSSVRLLEIEQQVNQNPSLVPPDFGMMDPFGRLSRLSRASWSIGFDLAQLLLGAPLSGFGPRQGDRLAVLFDSLRQLSGFSGNPGVDVVTLKQFRDSSHPALICYQALVESRLGVARYNSGGLLGVYNLLQADITGGFRIRLFDNPAFPIVESLGLEVSQERTVGGRAVSFLEPFFPFWMSVDLTYGKGETLCWRTPGEPWYEKKTAVGVRPKKAARYNTVAGGAEQVWHGPYLVPDARFDVYPLKADGKQLQTFLDRYLVTDGKIKFQLKTPRSPDDPNKDEAYVYMVVSANRLFSKARSNAWLQARQVAFYVPLTWGEPPRYALATPFAFVDNPVLAVTMREVQGVPAMNATIEAPSRLFRGPGPFLTMEVNVFAALGAGLRSQTQTLLEVRSAHGPSTASTAAVDCDLFDQVFPSQTAERLMLKQFRDAEELDRACYQSLVLEPWKVLSRSEPKPFDHEMEIHLYRYPSIPLAETLGLTIDRTLVPSEPGGALADVLTVKDAFKVNLSLEIGLGKELLHTAGFRPWRSRADPQPVPGPRAAL